MVDNVGTQLAAGLRPLVEDLGEQFFPNTVTVRQVVRVTTARGEQTTTPGENVIENVPAMITPDPAEQERVQMSGVAASGVVVTENYTILLNGYFPGVDVGMLLFDDAGREFDITAVMHDAFAIMTSMRGQILTPTGVPE